MTVVRILGEGQFRVPDDKEDDLNAIDNRVEAAVQANDQDGFTEALAELIAAVKKLGTPLADDELVPSDAVVPDMDTTLAEARKMLSEEGLIPD